MLSKNFECFADEKLQLEDILQLLENVEERVFRADLEVVGNLMRKTLEYFIISRFPLLNNGTMQANLGTTISKLIMVKAIKRDSALYEQLHRLRKDANYDSHASQVDASIEIVVQMLEDFHSILTWYVYDSVLIDIEEINDFKNKISVFDENIYYDKYENTIESKNIEIIEPEHVNVIEKILTTMERNQKMDTNNQNEIAKYNAEFLEAKKTQVFSGNKKMCFLNMYRKPQPYIFNTNVKFKLGAKDGRVRLKLESHPFLYKENSDGTKWEPKKISGGKLYDATGMNRFMPLSVYWLERLYVIKPVIHPKYGNAGKHIEDKQLDYYSKLHNTIVQTSQNEYSANSFSEFDHPIFTGFRDGVIDNGIIECKTTSVKKKVTEWKYEESLNEVLSCPESYFCQLGLYLYIQNEYLNNPTENGIFVVTFMENYEYYLGKWIIGEQVFENWAEVVDQYKHLKSINDFNIAIEEFENSPNFEVIYNDKNINYSKGMMFGKEAMYVGGYGEHFIVTPQNTLEYKIKWSEIKNKVIKIIEQATVNNDFMLNEEMISPIFENAIRPKTLENEILKNLKENEMLVNVKKG